MLERVSPLVQRQPAAGLSHRHCATLLQYHAWPERYEEMARTLASHAGAAAAPAPGKAAPAGRGTLLRIHPQRLWLLSEEASAGPALSPEIGATLDLSHARSIIRVAQDIATPLLSRFIAIDLRCFGVDDVVLTPIHRVGVALWRRAGAIDILAPRSFARSIWEVLTEAAERLR